MIFSEAMADTMNFVSFDRSVKAGTYHSVSNKIIILIRC
jgi:hypothetical protein